MKYWQRLYLSLCKIEIIKSLDDYVPPILTTLSHQSKVAKGEYCLNVCRLQASYCHATFSLSLPTQSFSLCIGCVLIPFFAIIGLGYQYRSPYKWQQIVVTPGSHCCIFFRTVHSVSMQPYLWVCFSLSIFKMATGTLHQKYGGKHSEKFNFWVCTDASDQSEHRCFEKEFSGVQTSISCYAHPLQTDLLNT